MHISADDVEKSIVKPGRPHVNLHSKSGPRGSSHRGSNRALEDQGYYHSIVEALQGAQEVLVLGPADAKLQLIKHVQRHDSGMSDQIVGVETVDHPTDPQIVAFAKKYFLSKDRMLGLG